MSVLQIINQMADLRSSRLIITAKDPDTVPLLARHCRFLLAQVNCSTFFCTLYVRDPEQLDEQRKNRVHIGVVWSDQTIEQHLSDVKDQVISRFAGLLLDIRDWEHFNRTETSFLIHCAAREYADFIVSLFSSHDDLLAHFDKDYWDAIHLIYNQLLLIHGDISPQHDDHLFVRDLYALLHPHTTSRG